MSPSLPNISAQNQHWHKHNRRIPAIVSLLAQTTQEIRTIGQEARTTKFRTGRKRRDQLTLSVRDGNDAHQHRQAARQLRRHHHPEISDLPRLPPLRLPVVRGRPTSSNTVRRPGPYTSEPRRRLPPGYRTGAVNISPPPPRPPLCCDRCESYRHTALVCRSRLRPTGGGRDARDTVITCIRRRTGCHSEDLPRMTVRHDLALSLGGMEKKPDSWQAGRGREVTSDADAHISAEVRERSCGDSVADLVREFFGVFCCVLRHLLRNVMGVISINHLLFHFYTKHYS